MIITGPTRLGRKTKELVRRLRPGDIAVISHRDLDAVAAQALIDAKVACVLDAETSYTGRFPNLGPKVLLEAGVPLVDGLGGALYDELIDGTIVEVVEHEVVCGARVVAKGRLVRREQVEQHMERARTRMNALLRRFVRNTLERLSAERDAVLGDLDLSGVQTVFTGRQVVVVARGQGYRDDLRVLTGMIRRARPILVAVDGGADALLEMGRRPDLIVGDMDSVSDRALGCGAEIVVHAYGDGRSPGMVRLHRLGLDPATVRAPGTSEDLAVLLAYQLGADLIVLVGAHWTMIDFLEKGRKGMSSTFLTRLKAAPVTVDARGLSRLVGPEPGWQWAAGVAASALFPLIALLGTSPWARTLARVLTVRLKATLAGLL